MIPAAGGTLLLLWLGFLGLMLAALTGVLVWAVRSRQFSDQERARYLALDRADWEEAMGEQEMMRQDKKQDGKAV